MIPCRSLSRFALFAALFLSASCPAWADAPIVIGPVHVEGVDVVGDCGTFQIVDYSEMNFTLRRMRDSDGNVVRLIEEVWGVDNLTNSVTGKSFAGPYHNNTFVDLDTRIAAIAGIIFRIEVPGVGAVFLDVGRVEVDREGNVYASAGPHQFFDGDFAALCTALE